MIGDQMKIIHRGITNISFSKYIKTYRTLISLSNKNYINISLYYNKKKTTLQSKWETKYNFQIVFACLH